MIDFKKIENICAIVLLVAFFLPWVSVPIIGSYAGYQIPGAVTSFLEMSAGLANFSFDDPNPEPAAVDVPFQVYLVYLIPLVAIAVLVADYLKTDEKTTRIISIVAGVIPVSGFIYGVTQIDFSALALGAFLIFLSGVGILLATFGVVKIPK